eukprot:COSAG01_NODE_2953_length_6803_cov_3.014471_3_plen_183_part_00
MGRDPGRPLGQSPLTPHETGPWRQNWCWSCRQGWGQSYRPPPHHSQPCLPCSGPAHSGSGSSSSPCMTPRGLLRNEEGPLLHSCAPPRCSTSSGRPPSGRAPGPSLSALGPVTVQRAAAGVSSPQARRHKRGPLVLCLVSCCCDASMDASPEQPADAASASRSNSIKGIKMTFLYSNHPLEQ